MSRPKTEDLDGVARIIKQTAAGYEGAIYSTNASLESLSKVVSGLSEQLQAANATLARQSAEMAALRQANLERDLAMLHEERATNALHYEAERKRLAMAKLLAMGERLLAAYVPALPQGEKNETENGANASECDPGAVLAVTLIRNLQSLSAETRAALESELGPEKLQQMFLACKAILQPTKAEDSDV